MYNIENYTKLLESRLSHYRFVHSLNVSEKAVSLAKKYGADTQKALVAGLLHDITKEEDLEVQKDYIKRDNPNLDTLYLSKSVYHQISGSAYCKYELSIDDEDILNAIRFHTTGRANMSLLEKIIYVADLTSKERNYPDVDVVREKAEKDLDDAILYSIKFVIKDLSQNSRAIDIDTIECYNQMIYNISLKEE